MTTFCFEMGIAFWIGNCITWFLVHLCKNANVAIRQEKEYRIGLFTGNYINKFIILRILINRYLYQTDLTTSGSRTISSKTGNTLLQSSSTFLLWSI